MKLTHLTQTDRTYTTSLIEAVTWTIAAISNTEVAAVHMLYYFITFIWRSDAHKYWNYTVQKDVKSNASMSMNNANITTKFEAAGELTALT